MWGNFMDLIFFRNVFTKEQKWYLVIFYIITGITCVVFSALILGLKLFIAFLDLLNIGSSK